MVNHVSENIAPEKKFTAEEHFFPVKNIDAILDTDPDFSRLRKSPATSGDEIITFEVMKHSSSLQPKSSGTPQTSRAEGTTLPAAPPLEKEPTETNRSTVAAEDFHLTVEIPGKKQSGKHSVLPLNENNSPYYLEIPSIHYTNDSRDEYEIETFSDLDQESIASAGDSARNTGDVEFPKNVSPDTSLQGIGNDHPDEHVPPAIDEAIEQLICNEPFLSEKDLFFLLKCETFSDFKLTRQNLRKRLRINGLETGYKRFRAYISG